MGGVLLLIPAAAAAAAASSSTATIIQKTAPLLLQFRHFTFFHNNNRNRQRQQQQQRVSRSFAADAMASILDPPDLRRLAETARISLTQDEIEEFTPKIQQVVDWFGQLQAVDLQSIEPAIRADTDGSHLRDDLPETFGKREAIIAEVPNYDEPFIKVPKVLNKE